MKDDYAFAVIWSEIKTWFVRTFSMSSESQIVAALARQHACDADALESAVQYLKYYGYLRDLAGGAPGYSLATAARWFQQIAGITVDGVVGDETLGAMTAPRCGVPDHLFWEAARWRKNRLNLFVEGFVPVLSKNDQLDLIAKACHSWSQHADVTFRFVNTKSQADIYVQALPLDGPGNVLAQAQLPTGDDRPLFLQMDSREAKWVKALENTRGEILFPNVIKHELGHNLGLGHSASPGARNTPPRRPIMASTYDPLVGDPQPDDDIPRIIALYGPATSLPEPPSDPPTPPAPAPQPPTGGKTMTKDELKAWLSNIARLVTTLAPWMVGPLSWVKPHLATLGGFLLALAGNDLLLDLILLLANRGQLTLPLSLDGAQKLKADVEALTKE